MRLGDGVLPRPKILHVVFGLDAGGTERFAVRLAHHWQNSAQQRLLAYRRASGVLEEEARAVASLEVCGPDGSHSKLAWARTVHHHVSCFRPDGVIIHGFGMHQLVAAAAARIAGAGAIACTAGNPPPQESRARLRWGAILLGSRLIGCPVASCSLAVERQLRALGVGMPKGSFAIPNGIHVARGLPPETSPPDRAQGWLVGMVARLDPIKDHATLLRAIAELGTDVGLCIVGNGPLRPKLEALTARLRIADRVRFVGQRNDVAGLLSQMHLFAFSTTEAEGFGIALTEAMAAGVPIVASDVAACREVLADGEAGMLVPPGNPRALADAIRALLGDRVVARSYAARAFDRVRSQYSIAECARLWARMLRLDIDPALPASRLH